MASHTGPKEDDIPESWEERHEVDDGGGKPSEAATQAHETIHVDKEAHATDDHAMEVTTGERRSTQKPEASGSQGEVSEADEVNAALRAVMSGSIKGGQEGGPGSPGNTSNTMERPKISKKPWVTNTTREWGKPQGDIRYKAASNDKLSDTDSNGNPSGGNPISGGTEKGGKVVAFRPKVTLPVKKKNDKVRKSKSTSGKSDVKGSGNDRKVKPTSKTEAKKGKGASGKPGKQAVTRPSGANGKPEKQAAKRPSDRGTRRVELSEDSDDNPDMPWEIRLMRREMRRQVREGKQRLIKMMEGVYLEKKGGRRGSNSEKEATSGAGNVNKPEKAVGSGVIQPSRLAIPNDARKEEKKARRVINFESEAERQAFLAAKRERRQRRLEKLKEKQRHRADAAANPTVPALLPPKPKGPPKAKEPPVATKATPKHTDGAPSSVKKAHGKDKSATKPYPGGNSSGKRAGGLAPYAPTPKRLKGQVASKTLVDEQMAAWLDNVDEASTAETMFTPKADLLTRHGSVTVSELASRSERMQEAEGRMEVSWSDPSDHPSTSNFHSAGRLRFHRTDPSSEGKVVSLDTEENADLMSAAMEAGSQVFHSSLLVELQRSIDQGKAFKCHQCSLKHTLIRSTTTVLITEHEQFATFRHPKNCTSECDTPKLPNAGPGTHSEILLLPSGLKGGIIPVFSSLYGQHKGPMQVIVNLGEGAIRDGETVESVVKQLKLLAQQISAVRPRSEREYTRVLIPLCLTSKEGQKVTLSSWDTSELHVSTQLRLAHLNLELRSLNARLGHVTSAREQESAVLLDCMITKEVYSKRADAGGRTMEQVAYLSQGNHLVDDRGRLHPTKLALYSRIQDILVYISSSTHHTVKWGYQHFN